MKGLPKITLDPELEELLDESSKLETSKPTKKIKSKNTKVEDIINIPIKEEDDVFALATKNLINNSGLTNQDLYDLKGQRDAYNMIYSFKVKNQLGIDRIKEWARILHKKPILTFVDMTDEEIKELEENE